MGDPIQSMLVWWSCTRSRQSWTIRRSFWQPWSVYSVGTEGTGESCIGLCTSVERAGNKVAWLLIPRASYMWCSTQWPPYIGIIQECSNMTDTAAAQCILFTHKSALVIFEPPCIMQDLHHFILYSFCFNLSLPSSYSSSPLSLAHLPHLLLYYLICTYFTPCISLFCNILFLSTSFTFLFLISYPSSFPPPTFPHSLMFYLFFLIIICLFEFLHMTVTHLTSGYVLSVDS
jgi:hypothetical protein